MVLEVHFYSKKFDYGEMLSCLGHEAVICSNDQKRMINSTETRQHVVYKINMNDGSVVDLSIDSVSSVVWDEATSLIC